MIITKSRISFLFASDLFYRYYYYLLFAVIWSVTGHLDPEGQYT